MELTIAPTPPVDESLDRLGAAMTACLFGDAARARLRDAASRLAPSNFLLFERHFGPGAPRIDLSIGRFDRVPPGLDFGSAGVDPRRVMLEYDLDGSPSPPSPFLTLPLGTTMTGTELVALAERLGARLDDARRLLLDRAARAVGPAGCWITHVGAMTARAGHPIRLNLGADSPGALNHYAEMLGCGEAARAALGGLFAIAAGLPLTFVLALDLGDAPLPRIGIECYAPPPEQAMPTLFARLSDTGLCSDAEARAALEWPDEGGAYEAASGRLIRSINHVKLVAEPNGVRAKAYLAATWVPEAGGPREMAA